MKIFISSQFRYSLASAVATVVLFGGATFAQASTLTSGQVQAIVSLLQAFNADQATIINVQAALSGQSANNTFSQLASSTNDGTVLQFSIYLRRGMSGEDVKHLQEILASDATLFSQDKVTGFFGPKTEEAVKHFQKRFDIEQVGFLGPKTIHTLNKLLNEHNVHGDEDIQENEFGDLDDNADEHDFDDNHHQTSTTTASTTIRHRDDRSDR